jgi:3-hydroxyacyl-CoA dehydrogenase
VEVDAGALAPAAADGRHVDLAAIASTDAAVGGRAAVAEGSAGAAGEDRCHPPCLPLQGPVADGIDADVEAMEAARAHGALRHVPVEPKPPELPESDDPVLAAGEVGDRPVPPARRCLRFGANSASGLIHAGHAAQVEVEICAGGARKVTRVSRVGVVGAGTMGAGIAQVAALGGFEAALHDPLPGALDRGLERLRADLARGAERNRWSSEDARAAEDLVHPAPSLADLSRCDLVIEAAPEVLELKRTLFADLETVCGPDAILATNTSSLSVTAIAAGVSRPERVVGMHFFNPPALMRLVEIVAGDDSGEEALAEATAAAERMGRTPIRAADGIGFVANRCVRPFTLESLKLVAEGVAFDQIDRIVRVGGGFRMGPFELMDLVGIDVNLEVAKSFWEQSFHEPRWRPSPLQTRLVDAGRLGRKSGRGWYRYDDGPHRRDDPDGPLVELPADRSFDAEAEQLEARGDHVERVPSSAPGLVLGRILAQLVNEAHFALGEGVATAADIDTAMRLGFNWPRGPFEWTEEIGAGRVVATLDALHTELGEECYRVAPALRRRAATEAR